MFGSRRPNQSFNPDVASVSHFSHDHSGILVSSHRAASATPVNSGLILGALLRIRGHYMVVEPQPAPNP